MAQLRRNHTRHGKGLQASFRMVVLLIIAILCFAIGIGWLRNKMQSMDMPKVAAAIDGTDRTYLPHSPHEVIHHLYYSLGYDERREQAAWVAYVLDKPSLQRPNVRRTDRFEGDNAVSTGSAVYGDYSRSGYTRGHLAPAGDMAFDETAMRESFLMSNVSPQAKVFNNGVWKELEMQVRNWAYDNEKVYVITGPLFQDSLGYIGKEQKVLVPGAFYKVILDFDGEEKKGIAFLIPHARSEKPLDTYMVTIDEIEQRTGIDFFRNMINDKEEEALESSISKNAWPLDPELFRKRVEKWNRE
jgi:endonuclease G